MDNNNESQESGDDQRPSGLVIWVVLVAVVVVAFLGWKVTGFLAGA
jgi:hypothetical protein